jgi:hypothetical protein
VFEFDAVELGSPYHALLLINRQGFPLSRLVLRGGSEGEDSSLGRVHMGIISATVSCDR